MAGLTSRHQGSHLWPLSRRQAGPGGRLHDGQDEALWRHGQGDEAGEDDGQAQVEAVVGRGGLWARRAARLLRRLGWTISSGSELAPVVERRCCLVRGSAGESGRRPTVVGESRVRSILLLSFRERKLVGATEGAVWCVERHRGCSGSRCTELGMLYDIIQLFSMSCLQATVQNKAG